MIKMMIFLLITSLNPRANACRKLVNKKLLIKKLVNTVDREIFAIKKFSSMTFSNEN